VVKTLLVHASEEPLGSLEVSDSLPLSHNNIPATAHHDVAQKGSPYQMLFLSSHPDKRASGLRDPQTPENKSIATCSVHSCCKSSISSYQKRHYCAHYAEKCSIAVISPNAF